MEQYKKGDRVGAILTKTDKIMTLFGYGTFQGDEVPEDELVVFAGKSLKANNRKNPCILLDSGKKVFGCECYWGDEEMIKEIETIAQKDGVPVNYVDVEEYRISVKQFLDSKIM